MNKFKVPPKGAKVERTLFEEDDVPKEKPPKKAPYNPFAPIGLQEEFISDDVLADMEAEFSVPSGRVPSKLDMVKAEEEVKLASRAIKKVRIGAKATQRLDELGFDPLTAQVRLYEKLEKEAERQERLCEAPRRLPNGDTQRFSSMAYNSTLLLQQKIANDLMRFAYARVSEVEKNEDPRVGGLVINLTGGNFDPNAVIDMETIDAESDDGQS